MSEYTEQAEKFLTAHNLTFRAVYVGEDCPSFCEDAAKGITLIPGTFPRKNHIHGSHWRLTISGKDRGHLTVDFWDSYRDAELRALGTDAYRRGDTAFKFDKAKKLSASFDVLKVEPVYAHLAGQQVGIPNSAPKPTAYDMLACVEKSDPGTFEDFASNFGYDEDSRKAESIYRAVVKQWRETSRFFTSEELTEAQEIQ